MEERRRGVSRRDFLLRGGAALAGLLVVPTSVISLPQTAEAAPRLRKGYSFIHGEDIAICLEKATDPRKLDIKVMQNGVNVESFSGVHPSRLRRIDSGYFRVRYMKAPSS